MGWLQFAGALALILFVVIAVALGAERLMNPPPKREWRAHSPSGQVSLGVMTQGEAIALVARLGKISFVDEDHAFIFYDTHLGGPPPEGQDSGPTR